MNNVEIYVSAVIKHRGVITRRQSLIDIENVFSHGIKQLSDYMLENKRIGFGLGAEIASMSNDNQYKMLEYMLENKNVPVKHVKLYMQELELEG